MNDNDVNEDCALPGAVVEASAMPIVSGFQPIDGAARPCGLALDFDEGQFVVQLWSDGGDMPIRLGPYADEDVIAVWRNMAAVSGLPLLLPGPDGALQQPYPQLGRLLIGANSDRRRLAVLSGRRPRFLAKRRPGVMPRRPRVHREPEIVTGHAP